MDLHTLSDRDANFNCASCGCVKPLLGLNFTVLCDSDLNQHDLFQGGVVANSVQNCVDQCNHFWGCYGVTFVQSAQRCYMKNWGVSVMDQKPNQTGLVSVIPNPAQLNQTTADVICPFPNLSEQGTQPGLDFTILCGAAYMGDDMYDYEKLEDEYSWMHADSLQECMEHCANHTSLCSKITYDSDKSRNPWLNCFLKTASDSKPVPANGDMSHSARAVIPTLKHETCKNDSTYTTADGRTFKTACFDYRNLTNADVPPVATSHQPTSDACMAQCSNASSSCVAASFDVGMQAGFKNCYLFNQIPPTGHLNTNFTFRYLESLSAQYRVSPGSVPQTPIKGEIAAAVLVPTLVTLLGLAVYWFWWRKRQSLTKYAHYSKYWPVKGE